MKRLAHLPSGITRGLDFLMSGHAPPLKIMLHPVAIAMAKTRFRSRVPKRSMKQPPPCLK
jgi:hypothetical protein